MAINIKQRDDGSTEFISESLGKSVLRLGGSEQPTAGGSTVAYHGSSYLKLTLGTTPATAGVASILNPYGEDVVVGRTFINITTADNAGTNHLTMGVGGASSTTYTNNLIDHITTNATGVFDNITDKGTNGKSRQLWASATYLTITSTITPLSLTGNAFLEIMRV